MRLRIALRTFLSLAAATIVVFLAASFVPAHALSPDQEAHRVSLTNAVSVDRRAFDPQISLQDWANAMVNYVAAAGDANRLSVFDKVFGDHAEYLLSVEGEFSDADLWWLNSTGRCESHNNPATDTGNGYYGEFQFVQSTWNNVARVLDPSLINAYIPSVPRSTQRRFALYLRDAVGRGQWPVCG